MRQPDARMGVRLMYPFFYALILLGFHILCCPALTQSRGALNGPPASPTMVPFVIPSGDRPHAHALPRYRGVAVLE